MYESHRLTLKISIHTSKKYKFLDTRYLFYLVILQYYLVILQTDHNPTKTYSYVSGLLHLKTVP